MPTTLTPELGLNLPDIGASRNQWGALCNDNFTMLDEFVSMATPIGAVLDFAGPNAPAGWLICDGRLVSRVTYSHLFAVIGTVWGAGDGANTFALPSTPGRASVGPGTVTDDYGLSAAFSFGQLTGLINNYIQQQHLPNINLTAGTAGIHSHGGASGMAGAHNHTTDSQGLHDHNVGGTSGGVVAGGDHNHTGSTSSTGAHAHNVTIPATGTGVASGTFQATSVVFGTANYTTDTQGTHAHIIFNSGTHQHTIYPDGFHTHTTTGVGDHSHSIINDGDHSHIIPLGGSGVAFGVLSPVIVFTKIIYAGQQAAVQALAAVAVVTSQRRLSAPMRGTH